jgi:MoaA/NifB/PqqE/SkfB family radical SAM enzyme
MNTRDNEIRWEVFLSIIKRIEFVKNICLCGMGEQLLHPKFYEIISALTAKKVSIITNGTIAIDYDRLFENRNIRSISFSVDGPNEDVVRKSCPHYNYKVLIDNLSRLASYPQIIVGINYVISAPNLLHICQMIEFASKYPINSINLLLPSYQTQWVKNNMTAIDQQLRKAIEIATKTNIEIKDPFTMKCIFENTVIPIISLAGKLHTCCDHYNRIPMIGSLIEHTFEELWNTPGYQKFRTGCYCANCNQYRNQLTVNQ